MRRMKYTFPCYHRKKIGKALMVIGFLGLGNQVFSAENLASNGLFKPFSVQDTILTDSISPLDTISGLIRKSKTPWHDTSPSRDTLYVVDLQKSPYVSVQQYLKGNIAGLYVQENNGEPGTIQHMLLRGISSPIFSNRDLAATQPTVYVNGMPLTQRHPYVYDIKQHDVNPIGSANNMLSGVDMNNILSVEIIKDPARLAQLGPLAANGAIWIQTNDAVNTRNNPEKVTLQTSYGVVTPPTTIRPTNATYEHGFRKQFYDAYNLPFGVDQQPPYLQDPSDVNYYGNANWPTTYYKLAQQYDAYASLRGGGENASLLFTVASNKNSGIADSTQFTKHNLNFFVTMQPVKNFWMDAMIAGTLTSRKRNKNQRDRYAETEYYTDFTYPLAPAAHSNFLTLYDESDDMNTINYINGYLKLRYDKDQWKVGAELLYDHNVDTRHIFWPSTLMESVSYISDFSGINRRIVVRGYAGYHFTFNTDHTLGLQLETNYNADLHRYNYTRAYDGTNDKYKTTGSGGYRTYNFVDKEQSRLVSSGFNIDYQYKDYLSLLAVMKYDGYSGIQPDQRWLFTPAFSARWNLKNQFDIDDNQVSDLSLSLSWARIGRLLGSDRFALGPNYTANNMSWENQWAMPSYNSFATLSRPYASGWSSYGIGWPYADKLNLGVATSLFQNRLHVHVDLYNNDDKDMLMAMPVPQEYGYSVQYLSGMHVNNKGVDVTLQGVILNNPDRFKWTTSWNLNYNKNTLKALPESRDELVIGNRKLKVGYGIDQFWVLENQGIYQNDIPAGMAMEGLIFQEGDAKWNDINQDNQINDDDKVMKGHALPRWTGGTNNHFTYKQFDFNFHLFFALGHHALNTYDARRYGFSDMDEQNTVSSLREIFFWQNTQQKDDYPIYHPESEINSYREDQDLFLENGTYLKLRSVSVGYTFDSNRIKEKKSDLYVYLVANNLWTLSNFSAGDPELVDFNGYYTGYHFQIPFSMSVGLRYKF